MTAIEEPSSWLFSHRDRIGFKCRVAVEGRLESRRQSTADVSSALGSCDLDQPDVSVALAVPAPWWKGGCSRDHEEDGPSLTPGSNEDRACSVGGRPRSVW